MAEPARALRAAPSGAAADRIHDPELTDVPAGIGGDQRIERFLSRVPLLQQLQAVDPEIGIDPGLRGNAPTPGFTKGQMPPTPGTAVDTATPSMPVLSQRAEIENVFTSSMTLLLSGGVGRSDCPPVSGRVWDSRDQGARVLFLRRLKHLFDGADLDDLSAPHDSDIVGDDADDPEIVTDEDASQTELAVGFLQQGEDLRLHGDVERRCRLVGQNQRRPQNNGPRDGDALTLAAGELVRVS